MSCPSIRMRPSLTSYRRWISLMNVVLPGTRMAHQPDALARRDARREMLVQWRVVRAVAEGHVVEADLALGDADRARARLVGHAQGLAFQRHQFLHVVDRALQVADVRAHFAQIALQHEEHGQREGDVAHAGLAARPQPQRCADHGDLHQRQHGALHAGVQRAAHPGAAGAAAPLVDHARQPRSRRSAPKALTTALQVTASASAPPMRVSQALPRRAAGAT